MITYSFSGTREEYKKLIRRFNLKSLLEAISKESAKIFLNNDKMAGVEHVNLRLINAKTGIEALNPIIVSGWTLVDLAYDAIFYTNDYRGKVIEDDNELYLLVQAKENLNNVETKKFPDDLNNRNQRILLYLWGFFGEQAKFQTKGLAIRNIHRELYILLEISKKYGIANNYEEIVVEETGLNWNKIVISLCIAFFSSLSSPNPFQNIDLFKWNNDLSLEEYKRVIELYSATYPEVRETSLGRQIFYTKPFVVTQRNQYLNINSYLTLFCYEHSIYWIIRNYYYKQKSRQFTSDFGKCFEKYFEELLVYCLDNNQYRKIPEGETKKADWEINIEEYNILIEQKSSLLNLDVKMQNTNVDDIVKFIKDCIFRAAEQLEKTEKELGDKKYIKIILLYEDYLKTDIQDVMFELDDCPIINDHYYWLVTIAEMEMLFTTYKQNPSKFKKIVNEKISREINNSNDGKSLMLLLEADGIYNNCYLEREDIKCYKNLSYNKVNQYFESIKRQN